MGHFSNVYSLADRLVIPQSAVRAVVLLGACLSGPAMAQDTDEQAPVFELSPFEVVTEDDGSYLAKNAVSATKFDTALKDIPLSLQVMNEAFLEDTFSLDLESAMNFAAAVNFSTETSSERSAGTREAGRFSIRGFKVLRVQRDGIQALYSQDLTNVARVEVMKGPASLLYGEVQPGGIINYIPKRPAEVEQYSIKLTGGSDAFFRTELEATGPLIKDRKGNARLLYRVDASYEEEDGWKRSEAHHKRFVSPVLEWRFTNRAKLTFQYENHNSEKQTTRGFRSRSTFSGEMWAAQKAIEDALMAQNPDLEYSRFIREMLFNGNDVELLNDTLFNGTFLPVQVVATDDGRFEVVGQNNVGILFPQHPELYATEEDGRWFLNDDPRLMVNSPNSLGTSTVSLLRDGLIELPYDFSFNHPMDFNHFDRDFYSVDLQTPLPFDNWHLRVNSVYDFPKIQVRESRLIGVNQANNGIIYRNSAFGHQRMENESFYTEVNISGKWELFRTYNQTIIGGSFRHDAWHQETQGIQTPAEFPDVIYAASTDDPVLNDLLRKEGRYFDFFTSTLPDFFSSDRTDIEARINTSRGLYVSNLSSFYDDRIKLLLGLRYNENTVRQYNDLEWTDLSGSISRSATSPQYGLIYTVNEAISIYGSLTNSFFPDGDKLVDNWDIEKQRFTDVGGSTRQPFEGIGRELGIKLDLWDSKLSGTIGIFDIRNENVLIQEEVIVEPSTGEILTAPTGTSLNRSIQTQNGNETSIGIDMDLIYSPSNSLQFVFSYAYIESETRLTNIAFDDTTGVPDHQASLWTRYRFAEGRFEGVSLGMGLFYTGNTRLFQPRADALEMGGDTTAGVYQDPFLKADMQVSYKGEVFGRETVFSLNVKNFTDEKTLNAGGIPTPPRQFFASVKLSF